MTQRLVLLFVLHTGQKPLSAMHHVNLAGTAAQDLLNMHLQ